MDIANNSGIERVQYLKIHLAGSIKQRIFRILYGTSASTYWRQGTTFSPKDNWLFPQQISSEEAGFSACFLRVF